MLFKGLVSSIGETGIRVAVNDVLTPPIKAASHVGSLETGQSVVVAFFSDSMIDGLIIAKY